MKMKNLCLSQFAKMYSTSWKDKGTHDSSDISDLEDEVEIDKTNVVCKESNKFDFIMTEQEEHNKPLEKIIRLENPNPGEPPFMKKRRSPAVLRFHKFKEDKEAEKYWFSECLLYIPFQKEEEIVELLENTSDYEELRKRIQRVKCQVMEFVESAEEARIMVGEALKNEDIGELINPEREQEIDDCKLFGEELHEDFVHLNPDDIQGMNVPQADTTYRPVVVEEKKFY